MNYIYQYFKLIKKAIDRKKVPEHIYSENHHVFPKSIFGDNDFIVNLTFKEHVVAHHLLYKHFLKKYGNTHQFTIKMGIAVKAFFMNASVKDKVLIRSLVNKSRVPMSPETKKKLSELNSGKNNPNYGRKGENHWHTGKKWSEQQKQKISESLRGRTYTQESIEKIRQSNILAKEKKAKKFDWINTKTNEVLENKSIMFMKRTYFQSEGRMRKCAKTGNCNNLEWVIKSQALT